jgi:hypothetical protein
MTIDYYVFMQFKFWKRKFVQIFMVQPVGRWLLKRRRSRRKNYVMVVREVDCDNLYCIIYLFVVYLTTLS